MKHLNYFPAVAAGVLALVLVQAGCGKKDPGNSLFFNARMDAIRQAGLPASLAELDAFYPEPAAGENAAGFYAEAFAALTVTDPKSPAYLVKNQAALELLHKAATKTQCRYPITLGEGPNCKLPHIGKIKAPAQLLGRVAVAHAAKGRSDLAAQAILDAFRLSGSLAQEPLLISQLVRISADSIACSALEEAIGLKSFTEPELSRLQAAVSGEATTLGPSLARAVAAERCWVLGVFQMPLTNYQDFSLGGTNCPFGQPADFERYRQGAVGKGDFDLALDYFSNWLAIASAPFPACLDLSRQWAPEAQARISEAKSKGYRVSAILFAALNTPIERAADCIGQLRAAELALAVERCRLANASALPASPAQLAPRYLGAIPDDPFDGQPLRYKKLPAKGYVTYSIGRNRQDDGGTPRPAEAKAEGPYDLTFTVRR